MQRTGLAIAAVRRDAEVVVVFDVFLAHDCVDVNCRVPVFSSPDHIEGLLVSEALDTQGEALNVSEIRTRRWVEKGWLLLGARREGDPLRIAGVPRATRVYAAGEVLPDGTTLPVRSLWATVKILPTPSGEELRQLIPPYTALVVTPHG